MAADVIPIRRESDSARLWDAYSVLVREQVDDPTLCVSLDHCQRLARAWAAWRDAFLAEDTKR